MRQNKIIRIAITGGIGSGKSTVSGILKSFALPVFSCDEIYSELCGRGEFLSKLEKEFGEVLSADGALDRKKLSKIVFNDASSLKKLNAITHPAIMEELFSRTKNLPLSFCEVPLLFENGFEKLFEGVIVVLRGKNERIESITQRDKISSAEALLRINSQFDYDKNSFAQYYVIHNDGNLTDLRQKTLEITQKIKSNTL